jgi:hypothetical protein
LEFHLMEKGQRISVGVSWLVEDAGIRVFGPQATSSRLVEYPEAAVWDFVTRGYPLDVIVSRLRCLDPRLAGNAANWVACVLDGWVDDGLLARGVN